MHYVYVLKSLKNGRLYFGRSDDLRRRLSEHKAGKVYTTARMLPVELVYYEAYKDEQDSKDREQSFKHSGSVYNGLVKRIVRSLQREIS
ncbi:MAG TPA: GIY-YIG nuclease family protein [Candidatus Paceibacterota bacterium]